MAKKVKSSFRTYVDAKKRARKVFNFVRIGDVIEVANGDFKIFLYVCEKTVTQRGYGRAGEYGSYTLAGQIGTPHKSNKGGLFITNHIQVTLNLHGYESKIVVHRAKTFS